MSPTRSPEQIAHALAEPFDPAEVHFKPAVVSGSRALALAYVDARAIQDRLDEVLGVDGWQDDYEVLADGSVVCRLRIRLGENWITKVDVGSPSEQPDGGDRLKAAFSDALKRVAVKFGIGRYLYRLTGQWVDYDTKRKQFAGTPKLPDWAVPGKPAPTRPKSQPADGTELLRRLNAYDTRLAEQGLFARGQLVSHVLEAVAKAGYGQDVKMWPEAAIGLAVEWAKAFEQSARSKVQPVQQA